MRHPRMKRFDYLDLARKVLERAEEIVVYSEVTDIEFIGPGFEDGRIFLEKATTLTKREVKE